MRTIICTQRVGAMAWGVFIFVRLSALLTFDRPPVTFLWTHLDTMQLYSLAGGIFLLRYGQYLFFFFPEWFVLFFISSHKVQFDFICDRQIYGGIGLGVAVCAALSVVTLANVSGKPAHSIYPKALTVFSFRSGHTYGHASANSFGRSSLSSAQYAPSS
jgi:hypothetical protein